MTEARGKYWIEYSMSHEARQAFQHGMTEHEVLTLVQRAYRKHAESKLATHPHKRNRRSLYLDAYKVRQKKYRYVPFTA